MIRGLISEYDARITEKWFALGNREEDDIFKFVAYWLAFIQLYNFDNYGDEEVSETTRIIDYCDKHIDELSDAIDFENGYMKVFKERPIISGASTVGIIHWQQDEETIARFVKERLNCNSYYKHKEDNEVTKAAKKIAKNFKAICNPTAEITERVKSLFCSIYRVRCNLFHGSKKPFEEMDRDAQLIHSSVEISN